MFDKILVPLDGSALAAQALPLALSLARRASGTLRLARVHGRTSARESLTPEDHAVRRAEQKYLDVMAWRLRESTGVFVAGQLLHGPVADALVEHAAAAKAGVIVLTTHGRGPLSRFWLGSVADKLIRAAPLPLLIHRPTEGAPSDLGADCRFHRILVPLDQTELGEQALAAATELARLFEAEITLLHVIVPVPVLAPDGVTYLPLSLGQAAFDATTKRARADLDDAAERLRGLGLIATARVVVDGQPASAILKEAESADLIVLATHGRGRVARFFLGSVADKVVRAAPCPVFIARSHSSAGGKT